MTDDADPAPRKPLPLWPWPLAIVAVVAGTVALVPAAGLAGSGKPAADLKPVKTSKVPPAIAAALNHRQQNIDAALKLIGDGSLTLAKLEAGNAALANLLKDKWDAARKERMTVLAFAADVEEILVKRYNSLAGYEPYPVFAERRRLTIDTARAYRAIDLALCDAYLTGKQVPREKLPEAIRQRGHALISRTLLETDPAEAAKYRAEDSASSFAVPGPVFERTMRRSGLTRNQLRAALTGSGTPGQRCFARIAIIEVVLELPRAQGETLLRRL